MWIPIHASICNQWHIETVRCKLLLLLIIHHHVFCSHVSWQLTEFETWEVLDIWTSGKIKKEGEWGVWWTGKSDSSFNMESIALTHDYLLWSIAIARNDILQKFFNYESYTLKLILLTSMTERTKQLLVNLVSLIGWYTKKKTGLNVFKNMQSNHIDLSLSVKVFPGSKKEIMTTLMSPWAHFHLPKYVSLWGYICFHKS